MARLTLVKSKLNYLILVISIIFANFVLFSFIDKVMAASNKINFGVRVGIKEAGNLLEFTSLKNSYTASPVTFKIRFINYGNTSLNLDGEIEIIDNNSSSIALFPISDTKANVLTDQEVVLTPTWDYPKEIKNGQYVAVLSLKYGETGLTTAKTSFQIGSSPSGIANSLAKAISKTVESVGRMIETSQRVLAPVVNNPIAQDIQKVVNIAVPIVVLTSATLPLLLGWSILDMLSRFIFQVLFLFGVRKRHPKPWGQVLDSGNNQPIPAARVSIFLGHDTIPFETQITDDEGRFGFLVESGRYKLKVSKKSYLFPSKSVTTGYRGEEIEVQEGGVIQVLIYLDPNVRKLATRNRKVSINLTILNFIRLPLATLGTIVAIVFYLGANSTLNTGILLLYLIFWTYEISIKPRSFKASGRVRDATTRRALAYSVICALDSHTKRLVETRSSDEEGNFHLLLKPGDYLLFIAHEGYHRFESKSISFKKSGSVVGDYSLQPLAAKNL